MPRATDAVEALIEKLQRPVSDLGLSVRTNNVLEVGKDGIDNLGKLIQHDRLSLLMRRNCGETLVRSVEAALEALDLRLYTKLPKEIADQFPVVLPPYPRAMHKR